MLKEISSRDQLYIYFIDKKGKLLDWAIGTSTRVIGLN